MKHDLISLKIKKEGEKMQVVGNLKLYSVDDCRRLFRLSNQNTLRLFHQADFPSIKLGRSYWIEESNLIKYLSVHRNLSIEKSDIELVSLSH